MLQLCVLAAAVGAATHAPAAIEPVQSFTTSLHTHDIRFRAFCFWDHETCPWPCCDLRVPGPASWGVGVNGRRDQ